MNRKMLNLTIGLITIFALLFTCAPSIADEEVEALKQQIEQLQKRVEELESSQPEASVNHQRDNSQFRRARSWDPFEEMYRMQEEMDRMFQNSFSFMGNPKQGIFSSNMSFDYDFDLNETDNGYEILFDTQGLDEEKIDIEVNEHSITVKGEHSRQDTEEDANRVMRSQSYGSFMKTIPLPVDADTSKMKTEKKGGNLVITLPKKLS